ncbi:MAG: hypothetical protein H8E66_20655 [Planctomycetes bacterium]|nr:hypothetical protein [Planctomycetota bacterium]
MTSQHDKPMRWRPRFSVRTLVVVVTLVCLYAACWGPTKTTGEGDVSRYASRRTGFDLSDEPSAWTKRNVRMFDVKATVPLVVGATTPGAQRRHYYFWFLGYVAKLPYERSLPSPELQEEWSNLVELVSTFYPITTTEALILRMQQNPLS